MRRDAEQAWFWSRVGIVRSIALFVVGAAILTIVGAVVFGLVNNAR